MLRLTDVLLTVLHFAIVGFNLFGWIPVRTRPAHLVLVLITAASWLILGIWYGLGYCPVTDWQWQVKTKLGEQHLPASFITYYADKISGRHFSDAMIGNVTGITFVIAAAISIYLNFVYPGWKKHRRISDSAEHV